MQNRIKELIEKLTLQEKASLCSGQDFWNTKPIPRMNIPPVMMTDGPHGLRKQASSAESMGLDGSVPSTCFPSAAGLACSWDRDLIAEVGTLIGRECVAEDVSILLGPAVNIKRSPLGGRNFEYYSEDPLLTGELAAAFIRGVQSTGVGTSVKHFAANNQETNRMTVDARIDEKTLREIYLKGFEIAVKAARPWTVMCAYNKINGTYCSENRRLLTEVLREEWGFDGVVVSDWGAVNERDKALDAGLDLEMPFSFGAGEKEIITAVQEKRLKPEVLDRAVERILDCVFRAADAKAANAKKGKAAYSAAEHHEAARRVASECMVLLKNENGILPLKKDCKLAVIGSFAVHPRYQGGGSSHITPTVLDSPLDEIRARSEGAVEYAQGYRLSQEAANTLGSKFVASECDKPDPDLIREACEKAEKADVAVIFAGLPDHYESEGYDRVHLSMPEGHIRLIEEVEKVQKNVVVVLQNGAPVEMPWLEGTQGVLECYLGGQGNGSAVASLLFGESNPCGKLAETFPKALSDNPSYLNFPGKDRRVVYAEGPFVGYRYYDCKKMEPLFPFGYGLSYTSFEYGGLRLSREELTENDTLEVSFTVRNTGARAGKEIAELYVRRAGQEMPAPHKELKGFVKVPLEPGEEKRVAVSLDRSAFSHYDETLKTWTVEGGEYSILVGSSSRDIRLSSSVRLPASRRAPKVYSMNSTLEEILEHPEGAKLLKEQLGEKIKWIPDFIRTSPLRTSVSLAGLIGTQEAQGILDRINASGNSSNSEPTSRG